MACRYPRSVQIGPTPEPSAELILYCLTRDAELAAALDARLLGALALFYNDAARLRQAVMLRAPDTVVVDTAAIRPEYGDSGLAPEIAFLRQHAPAARVAVRPTPGAELLVAAEAGPDATMLPPAAGPCVDAVARFCGCA
jgi:hypothetical protein